MNIRAAVGVLATVPVALTLLAMEFPTIMSWEWVVLSFVVGVAMIAISMTRPLSEFPGEHRTGVEPGESDDPAT
jgi:hypothetical protein